MSSLEVPLTPPVASGTPRSTPAKLLALAGSERRAVALTAAVALADAAAGIAIAILAGRYMGGLRNGLAGGAVWYLLPLALAVGLKALFAYLATRIGHDTSFGIMAELRSRLFRHLEALAPGYLVQRRTGDVVAAAIADVETLELFFAHNIPATAVALFVPTTILIVVAALAWPVALLLAPLALAAAIVPRLVKRRIERQSDVLRRELGEVNALFVDSLQGLPTLAAFGHEQAQAAQIGAASRRAGAASVAVARLGGLQSAASELVAATALLAVLGAGGVAVVSGTLSFSSFVVLFVLSIQLFQPILALNELLERLHPALAAARRIFAILEAQPEVADRAATSTARPADGTVAFQDVTFAYAPGLSPATDGVTFTVPAGQCAALVGPSGAGKSTLIHLLQRFWDPQAGRILLGGVDVRELPLAALRDQIAVVPQDVYLFNVSILENLRLGRPDATREQVEAAARAANIHDFIAGLPDGYNTVVGERGARLSGGQKQRLAIARALLKDAPVLLLDEATSNVDTETEQLIQEALARLMAGRTSIVIAHRLATIRRADLVLVLDRGRLVEAGPPADLLAQDGAFAALLRAQGLLAGPAPTPAR
ncbi:MAG TPA: ABC transporter ATP-binding protein [Chloroflexota bacterium]|nr:ABC transporter ATP-binding protein [Chloroflexota bacterium]